MKRMLCVMSLMCANPVWADSMLELQIRSVDRHIDQFDYAIETKNYSSACTQSRMIENSLAEIGSMLTGESREEIKLQGIKQHAITDYVCSIK